MVITCDVLDSSTSEPSVTSTLCSKCDASCFDDELICKHSLGIENDVLAKKVSSLTNDLEKASSVKAKLDFILGSQ